MTRVSVSVLGREQRNRRFSWSYTIWDMSVDVKLLVGKKPTREPGNQGTGESGTFFFQVNFGGKTRENVVCVVYSHGFCHNKTVNSKNS